MNRHGWQDAASVDESWRYTKEQEAAILEALGLAEDTPEAAEALTKVTEAAHLFGASDPVHEDKPLPSFVTNQLQEVAERAGSLADLLHSLDQRAADAVFWELWEARSNLDPGRLQKDLRLFRIMAARSYESYPTQGGRPKDVALHRYVSDLVAVWESYGPPGTAKCYKARGGGYGGNLVEYLRLCMQPALGPDRDRLVTAEGILFALVSQRRKEGHPVGKDPG